jgi:MSHA biogenesis protein MshK
MTTLRRALAAAVGIASLSTATAQSLRDPTRPPAAASAKPAASSERPDWVLQSVLISPERRYAIINGEVVRLGGSVAGAELIAVGEERVTLRTREGIRIVHLLPDVTRLTVDTSAQQRQMQNRESGSSGPK